MNLILLLFNGIWKILKKKKYSKDEKINFISLT